VAHLLRASRTAIAGGIRTPLLPHAQAAALSDVLADELGQFKHRRLGFAVKKGLKLVTGVEVAPVLQVVRSKVFPRPRW
jgi:hypothetical protein